MTLRYYKHRVSARTEREMVPGNGNYMVSILYMYNRLIYIFRFTLLSGTGY